MEQVQLQWLDWLVIVLYAVIIVGTGLWVSRTKSGHGRSSEDYFLAGKALPWWAIGASLIAANISAEQFIGMSGSGFALGLAIASYEWMAAATLIIVGKFFLPIFIKQEIYTIPQFVEQRYSKNLKTILAIFWLAIFVLVNLTTVMLLGAKALDTILGTNGDFVLYGILIFAFFSIAYSLYGGLSAVAWTDIIQVVMLVAGGVVITVLALSHLGGISEGLATLYREASSHFHMILEPDHKEYINLPGLAVLIGGLWVANLYYWGFNQYIIQRTFAAKSLKEAQKGIVFAAYLKMLIPFIVVIPGILAYVLYQNPTLVVDLGIDVKAVFTKTDGSVDYDKAFPFLVQQFVPVGIMGLVLAALSAAIISSLASMLNSISTIFTMDIYKEYINRTASEGKLVMVGRMAAFAALVIACFLAPSLQGNNQIFQVIQEYTGLVSPGVLAIFLLGFFWKKTTNKAAIWGAVSSIALGLTMKIVFKSIGTEFPWMHQMGIVFVASILLMILISHYEGRGADDEKKIVLSKGMFHTDSVFNIASFGILILLAFLYSYFW